MSSSKRILNNMTELLFFIVVVSLSTLERAEGHGRLIDPPGRSSMWRFGFDTPVNYDDNALYCGGFDRQWNANGGRCGVCGDPYDGARENEAGGRYARGVIAGRYHQGQTISVTVELTRSHQGWFEFRLCPNNDPRRRVTQRCLDSNLLRLTDGSTRYQVRSWTQTIHRIQVRLPSHVTCYQCVLQWKYNAGNSWGCFGRNTHCCVGCGHQEQFYGCADVAISASNSLYPSSATGHRQMLGSSNGKENSNNVFGGSMTAGRGSVDRNEPLGLFQGLALQLPGSGGQNNQDSNNNFFGRHNQNANKNNNNNYFGSPNQNANSNNNMGGRTSSNTNAFPSANTGRATSFLSLLHQRLSGR